MDNGLKQLKAIDCVMRTAAYCSSSGNASPVELPPSTVDLNCTKIPPHSSPVTPNVASSPTLSATSSSSSSQIPNVSDEDLAHLPVRQLNQRLQGHDRQIVSALKQKRRTLKNRGYAFNCRVRRIQNQLQLEADNVMLKDQVRYLKQMLHDLQMRLAYYEPISDNIIHSGTVASIYPQPYMH
ncbi:Transcription factor Maf [Toxocara canis]|uniref:Neural retina-specific leucine zipper protein n=2 Tax=Toxocara canis TaxID=6265 RepID=A0A0B2W4F0_TOXCA|nr:Transcription factor Maf [Toxocara canis]VDM39344.1 unnamed protein product [Toxocara canis]